MSETLEVQMVRLQEQLKAVITSLSEDRDSRKESDKQLTSIAISTANLDRRLEVVEKQLAKDAPTIEEFITIKHQVKGAGMLGRWLWLFGGMMIAGLFNAREAIRGFLQ